MTPYQLTHPELHPYEPSMPPSETFPLALNIPKGYRLADTVDKRMLPRGAKVKRIDIEEEWSFSNRVHLSAVESSNLVYIVPNTQSTFRSLLLYLFLLFILIPVVVILFAYFS